MSQISQRILEKAKRDKHEKFFTYFSIDFQSNKEIGNMTQRTEMIQYWFLIDSWYTRKKTLTPRELFYWLYFSIWWSTQLFACAKYQVLKTLFLSWRELLGTCRCVICCGGYWREWLQMFRQFRQFMTVKNQMCFGPVFLPVIRSKAWERFSDNTHFTWSCQ